MSTFPFFSCVNKAINENRKHKLTAYLYDELLELVALSRAEPQKHRQGKQKWLVEKQYRNAKPTKLVRLISRL